ncbi:unnamed protein product [Meloidogyne enterolobii]|uniref:Uncharacterized protein n=1 Tax=Meloidogyne enterolobii TaxID=390850 RepID=A0ACB1AF19_MELEN
MKLSVSHALLLTCLSIQCIHFAFINAACPAGWDSRTDSSGVEYGYQVVLQKNITFSQAQSICSGLDSDIVSIHSKDENEFIYGLIKTSGVVLYIGMQQVSDQYSPTCSFSDKSDCNFGNFNGVKDPKRQEYPWVRNPSITTDGNTVHCVRIVDTTYNFGKPNFKWNDVGCNDGLDGTICKKKCIGGNSGGSASTAQTPEASKASTLLPANTAAPVVSTKSANGGGSSIGPVVTSKPSAVPVVSTKSANGGGSSIGPVVTSKPSGAPVVSTKSAIGGGSSIGPVVTAQSPKTFATLLPGFPGSTPKPANGGGNNGSCGNCNCNDGYKCGSDDWQVKHGKDGSFAYKYFPAPNSSYFTAKAICAKYHALPCSINSEEENEFLLENVANIQLKSKKRAKREIQDSCIWTGIHIAVTDNHEEENDCYCDDGKECSYGHKKEDNKDDDNDKEDGHDDKKKKEKGKDDDKKKKEKEDKKKEKEDKKKEKEEKDKKDKDKKKEKDDDDKKKKEKEEKDKKKEEKDKKKEEKEDKKKKEKEEKDKKKKEKEDKKKKEKEEKDKKKKDKKDKSKDDSDEDDHKKCSCKGKKKPPSPWAPGCPSKPGGGDKKHCVGIGNDGKWKDVNCEKPGTGIICKRPCSP